MLCVLVVVNMLALMCFTSNTLKIKNLLFFECRIINDFLFIIKFVTGYPTATVDRSWLASWVTQLMVIDLIKGEASQSLCITCKPLSKK